MKTERHDMGAITPIGVTRAGEYVMDIEQHAADEAQHQKEQRQSLVHRRAEEIQAARTVQLSVEDIAVALERLSTYPKCIAMMRVDLAIGDAKFGETVAGLIR